MRKFLPGRQEVIGICFSGPRADRAAGRPTPPAGPGALPRAAPAVQFRPRPRNEGKYLANRTRLPRGNSGGDQGLLCASRRPLADGGPARGARPPEAMGLWRVDYAAMRPVAGDMATGTPAGGLWAWAGQSPRLVRIFPVCRARHRQVDDLGLLDEGDDPHWSCTPGTHERIHLVDLFDQPCPRALRGRGGDLGGFLDGGSPLALSLSALASTRVAVAGGSGSP